MKRFVFLKNTLIMTATSTLLRTVGMVFRVYISNRIGAEGMGLYQLIFSIYILASTFATSGISVAVTRVISEASGPDTKKSVTTVLNRAFIISLSLGILSALALYSGSGLVCRLWLKDTRAVLAIKILAPSLPFMSVSSCLYGYFIARRRVSVTSSAQIFEQLIRIAVVALCFSLTKGLGISQSCAAVMLGNTLADVAACVYIYIGYRLDLRNFKQKASPSAAGASVTARIVTIAAPIAAGSYLTTVLRTIENLLVPSCLTQYNFSREKSLSEFGNLKGMAMPVLFFPSSFLSSLSTLLIPEISEANVNHRTLKLNRTVILSLKICLASSLFISGYFSVYAYDLGRLLYKSAEVGFYIRVLGPIMPLIYLESIVIGILNGLNQQVSSLRYNVIDSVTRISMILAVVPLRGMQGFLFVMLVSNLLTSFLNLRRLLVVTKLRPDWTTLAVRPAFSIAAACALTVHTSRYFVKLGLLTPVSEALYGLAFMGAVYLFLLFITGCLKKSDLARAF